MGFLSKLYYELHTQTKLAHLLNLTLNLPFKLQHF